MRAWAIAFAFMATAASAAEPEQLDVNPEWIRKPNLDAYQVVWPRKAMLEGKNGRGVIRCEIATTGALEACKVVEETPPGYGFGEAALLLAPLFLLKPGERDGKKVRGGTIQIPIVFKTGAPHRQSDLTATPMVTKPVWEAAPSFADLAAAWPPGASVDVGQVAFRCGLQPDGRLENCRMLTEFPTRNGFRRAALEHLVPKFRMRVGPGQEKEIGRAYINLPIRFINPAGEEAKTRTIIKPAWINQLDPAKVAAVYPDKAADAKITSGRGVADCLVAADGKLTDCKPASEAPEDYGFAQSAVAVASTMRMNPWSEGGGPVDGVRLRLPITFNLEPDAPSTP